MAMLTAESMCVSVCVQEAAVDMSVYIYMCERDNKIQAER